MAGKNIPQAKTIVDQTRKYMKAQGTYHISFSRLLSVYGDTLHQFYFLQREWEESGYKTHIISGENSVKKNPLVDQLNTLRKDVISLSDRLMLNPKSTAVELSKTNGNSVDNPMAEFLKKSGM